MFISYVVVYVVANIRHSNVPWRCHHVSYLSGATATWWNGSRRSTWYSSWKRELPNCSL